MTKVKTPRRRPRRIRGAELLALFSPDVRDYVWKVYRSLEGKGSRTAYADIVDHIIYRYAAIHFARTVEPPLHGAELVGLVRKHLRARKRLPRLP